MTGMMEDFSLESGYKETFTGLVTISLLMELRFMGSILMTRRTGLVSISGQTVDITMATGNRTSNTVWEYTLIQRKTKEIIRCGVRANA